MRLSSGAVSQLPQGEYRHAPSKTLYRMEGNQVRIETPLEKASQKLDYFIGSGVHGRSYLFLRNRKLFQAPVTHYAGRGWQMSPGYEADDRSDWTRPIDRNCLWCHASGTKPIYGRTNEYAMPFTEGGISCERCHGDVQAHLKSPAQLPVNPVKLSPQARNDVCRQCHLLGMTRADKPGHTFFEFKAGMQLDSLVHYAVAEQTEDSALKVTGHFERLAKSKCQMASGDKLWCGTCHNPHPAKVVDANASCRSCHELKSCGKGPDCQACHMRKMPSPEANHSVFTDHWIR